jgi:hypothetical protein
MSIGIIGAGNIGLAVAKTGGFDNCSFAVQQELCNTIPQKRTLVSKSILRSCNNAPNIKPQPIENTDT